MKLKNAVFSLSVFFLLNIVHTTAFAAEDQATDLLEQIDSTEKVISSLNSEIVTVEDKLVRLEKTKEKEVKILEKMTPPVPAVVEKDADSTDTMMPEEFSTRLGKVSAIEIDPKMALKSKDKPIDDVLLQYVLEKSASRTVYISNLDVKSREFVSLRLAFAEHGVRVLMLRVPDRTPSEGKVYLMAN